MTLYIAPIVEGHTEQKAGCVERLLQRVWRELLVAPIELRVLQPTRCQRDAFINPNHSELTNKVEKAYAKLALRLRCDPNGHGALLLLLYAEGDCPKKLAPRLLAEAKAVRGDADIFCVLAKRMLENWMVAGCSTLAGMNGLPKALQPPQDPEECSGSGWLDKQLRRVKQSRKYKKTADAEVFVRAMSLQDCRDKAPSFDKLCRELESRVPPPAPEPPEESPPPDPPADN